MSPSSNHTPRLRTKRVIRLGLGQGRSDKWCERKLRTLARSAGPIEDDLGHDISPYMIFSYLPCLRPVSSVRPKLPVYH